MSRELTSRAAAMVGRLVNPTALFTAALLSAGAWTAIRAENAPQHICNTNSDLCMDVKEIADTKVLNSVFNRLVTFSASTPGDKGMGTTIMSAPRDRPQSEVCQQLWVDVFC